MAPKQADPNIRNALIEHAARLIAEEGSQALTLRRLTNLVGVSTMAVYTHFGSMSDLRRAIRNEGFVRLAGFMDRVEQTDDTVADLAVLGWAYYESATQNPNLYRAMFMEDRPPEGESAIGMSTFERLVGAVRRCIDAERFPPPGEDPWSMAIQTWAIAHGVVSLSVAGYLTDAQARTCLADMSRNLLRSFAKGSDSDSVDDSMDHALERIHAMTRPRNGATRA